MSKPSISLTESASAELSSTPITFNLDAKIVSYTVDRALLEQFLEDRKNDKHIPSSLRQYIQDREFKGQNVIVVPNFNKNTIEGIDLSGLDFTGCNVKGAIFQNITLKDAVFADADLSGVLFNGCDMKGMDLRGADISGCRIDPDEGQKQDATSYEGIKFSTTHALLRGYIAQNHQILAEKEREFAEQQKEKIAKKTEEIAEKEAEIAKAYKKLGVAASLWNIASAVVVASSTGDARYDQLLQDKQKLQQELEVEKAKKYFAPDAPYIVSPSFIEVMNAQHSFDHGYIRGSSKQERDQPKQYVRMTREDAVNYIEAVKTHPGLSINKFAEGLMGKKNMKNISGAKIVADFSSVTLPDGRFDHVDLSNLNFSQANLQEACFSGTNLRGCNFTEANLSKAIFESADLTQAKFNKTKAPDTNFFYCNMEAVTIDNSDFQRAFMRGSSGIDSRVDHTNLDYSNIQHGKWDHAQLSDSSLRYADLEGISLSNAILRKMDMQYSILNKAVMERAQIIESDFTRSIMSEVNARSTKFIGKNILKEIDAPRANFTEAELDKLCVLQDADLREIIAERMKAEKVTFTRVNLEKAKLDYAEFAATTLDGVNAKFASLRGAVIKGCEASKLDISGANLDGLQAQGMKCKDLVAQGVKARSADFEKAVMEGVDLRWAEITESAFKDVMVHKAKFQGAKLNQVNFKDAYIDAEVDAATDLHGSRAEGAKGVLRQRDASGGVSEISIQARIKEDDQIHSELQRSGVSRFFMHGARKFAKGCKKAADFIAKPLANRFGKKWGGIVVGVIFGVVTTGIVASTVFTGGLNLATAAIATAATALVSSAVGVVVGRYAVQRVTAVDLAVGVVAGSMLGVGGAAVGIAASNYMQLGTGVASSVQSVGTFVEGVVGPELSPRIETQIHERRRLQAAEAEFSRINSTEADMQLKIDKRRRGVAEGVREIDLRKDERVIEKEMVPPMVMQKFQEAVKGTGSKSKDTSKASDATAENRTKQKVNERQRGA